MGKRRSGLRSTFIGAIALIGALQVGLPFFAAGGTGVCCAEAINISYGTQTVDVGQILEVNKLIAGTLIVKNGGSASVVLATGGEQKISGDLSVKEISGGKLSVQNVGSASVLLASGGTQDIFGTLIIKEMSDGTQTVHDAATIKMEKMTGGTQIIKRDGTYHPNVITIDEMTGGTQQIEKSRTGTVATMTGGTQSILDGATGKVETMTGGTQSIANGATGIVTLLDGGTQDIATGGRGEVTSFRSGTVQVAAGGSAAIENMYGGTLRVAEGGSGSVTNLLGGETSALTVQDGATQTLRGGRAVGTTVAHGGTQIVQAGAVADGTVLSGVQEVQAGGLAERTQLKAGGEQQVYGTARATAVESGGRQYVGPGGQSLELKMVSGAELTVDDGGLAQLATATGGTVKLLTTGGAVLLLGTPGTTDSFTLDALSMTGDTVVLGQGSGSTAVPGNVLNVTTLNGAGHWVINTDIAAGTGDYLHVTGAASSTGNGVRINYDPSLAAGQLPSGSVCFATAAIGTLTFAPEVSEIGGYAYLPELSFVQSGSAISWYINGARRAGDSPLMLALLGQGHYQLARWRAAEGYGAQRLAELRSGAEHGLWLNMGRGAQRTGAGRERVKDNYNELELGWDRPTGRGWTVGGSLRMEQGSESYAIGSGESRTAALNLYAQRAWDRGGYVRFNARAGRLQTESDWHINGLPQHGRQHRWGKGAGAAAGYRLRLGHGWAITPEIGFGWAGLNEATAQLSEGSELRLSRQNSVPVQGGLRVERSLDRGSGLFLHTVLTHDLRGEAEAKVTKGETNRLKRAAHDTGLETVLGWQLRRARWSCHALLGKGLRHGDCARPWSWQLGAEWCF